MSENKLLFADTLRGLAALAVVISHTLIFSGVSASLGQFGVGLFFIISGFVIPLSLDRYDRKGFVISRLFRIYPTYWAAFSITVAVAYLQGRTYPLIELVQYYLIIRDLFGPAALDPIIWTLLIETKFYFLCFVLMPLFVSKSRWLLAVPVALLLFCLAQPYYPPTFVFLSMYSTAQMIIFMFVGVAFFLHFKSRISTATLCLASLVYFAAMKFTWNMGPAAVTSRLGWSYLPAILIFGFCYLFRDRFSPSRSLGLLSGISYPLYIVHVPIIMMCTMTISRTVQSPKLSAFIGAVCAIIVAYVLHILIENPSQQIGKKLAKMKWPTLRSSEDPAL